MMRKILGIGNALVDVMTILNDDTILKKFGLPKGSMQLVDNVKSGIIKSDTQNLKRTLASGGSVANSIHGLAMLGVESGFIGSIGKDETGDFFESDMKKAGVNTMLIRRESYTGTAVALISPDSERTFATHLGAAVELEAKDLHSGQFKGYDIFYVEGYLIINKPLVETACALAKENNVKVAIDLASYNVVDSNLENFREIINKYADIVFANADEARSFTGLEPEGALDEISKQVEIAVVKSGPEGSWIKRGDEKIKIDAASVNLIDTTGAGDLYASGFLYGLATGQDLVKCGLYGSILAGHVIEIVGARMGEEKWIKARKDILEIVNSEH
ncbi:MAG TPA: adenosine kinase [Bacteroidales bacterium]|nr:adenosine kinase [Bacteroidales bacterium]